MRIKLLMTLILFGLCEGVFAGDLQEGHAAYDRGDYASAFAKFKAAAEQGDSRAQYNLGVMYVNGKGIVQDDELAVYWWTKAAEQSDADAQFSLGRMYSMESRAVAQNYVQAVYWYEKAALQGHVKAEFKLGVMYEAGEGFFTQDYKQAVIWYTRAAEQGYADAQNYLGVKFLNGQGVAKDGRQALLWFHKAAEQGDTNGLNWLGYLYYFGQGAAQDYKLAAYWYSKAAALESSFAQDRLGMMYADGKGVTQDFVQAHMWWNLAASHGDLDSARQSRAEIESHMTAQQVAEAQRLAREWKPESSVTQESAAGLSVAVPTAPPIPKLASSGTGFYISPRGHVLTNAHVVEDCSSVAIEPIGELAIEARVVARDARNDLAIVQSGAHAPKAAAFRAGSLRQGDSIVAYGFPLPGAVASTGNATAGNVSALAGLNDDTRMLQISAPVQPGNSGGPLMDMTGAVVGVVVGKLNAAKVTEVTGDIPQNINFAIKAHVAKGFLESHGVEYETVPNTKALSIADVADIARAFAVRVLCYR